MERDGTRSASMSELYSLWSIQESLLQSYRMIFITSEAIFLSVAAAVAATQAPWVTLIIAIPGLFVMVLWTSVTRARAHHVSFVQDMIRKAEGGDPVGQPLTQFKALQEAAESGSVGIAIKSHQTRQRLEIWLPLVFWLAWLLLLACAMYLWSAIPSLPQVGSP